MNWFKRQSTLVKIILVSVLAMMCLCTWIIGLMVIALPKKEEMAATPTSVPIGLSRDNPAPLGQPVVADNKIEITVLGIERNAWAKIQQINPFNPEPEEGMEYIIITLRVRNLGDPAKTKLVSPWHFRVVGERGVIYKLPFFLDLEKELSEAELFGGGVIEGQLGFQVGQGEKNLVLIYDSGLDTTARYLSLER